MIPARELLLLMNSADSPANLDSIEHLIVTGLSAFTTDADAITGANNDSGWQRRAPEHHAASIQRISATTALTAPVIRRRGS
jgi:hypothetical protein